MTQWHKKEKKYGGECPGARTQRELLEAKYPPIPPKNRNYDNRSIFQKIRDFFKK